MTIKIKAPKGFEFKIRKDKYDGRVSIELHPKDSKKKAGGYIGRVNLVKAGVDAFGKDVYETHSYLNEDYRQRGFGTLMYARAIQWGVEHGYKVRSSTSTSAEAQRVWNGKSIRQFFSVKKKSWRNRYGSDVQRWYAYDKNR